MPDHEHTPAQPTDQVERVYRGIRDMIVDGRYRSGDHLTAETLANRFGVSRTPVREALRRLHSEGLVSILPNRGAHVAGWSSSDLDEVFGLRAVLESYAAELATTALTDDQIDELSFLAGETLRLAVEKPEDFRERIAAANSRLHRIIITAAANRRLAAMIASVVELPLIMRTLHFYHDEDLLRSAGHHRELVTAFRVRDPQWAGSVMRSHLRAAHHVMRSARSERAETERALPAPHDAAHLPDGESPPLPRARLAPARRRAG
jgi:DNA-binding GntR family transcriptional regulator